MNLLQCVHHQTIHRKVGLWCGSTAGRRREGADGGTARRVGQMLLFLAFVKSSKTLFPNTWHRPLILWVWGRMKESEGGRKEDGEINGEKTLLGVVWICFTPCCLDCFLFLHTAATKLRIPIGRHGNARQQHGNKHFLTGLHGKQMPRCTVQQETMMAAARHIRTLNTWAISAPASRLTKTYSNACNISRS